MSIQDQRFRAGRLWILANFYERLFVNRGIDMLWEAELARRDAKRLVQKQPLQPHQRGRTHRKKPRGTRKPWYRRGKWAQMKRYAPCVYEYLIGRVDESRVKR